MTRIETAIPADLMPGLLALRIHTDAAPVDGVPVVGHGETYYIPEAAAAVVHDWMARRLLGADATAIEDHWQFLFERMTAFGGLGAELRALSAIELALRDIHGQLVGQPIWQLLGGPVRETVPVYNSCGGPFYGRANDGAPRVAPWPGHGDPGRPGPLEDNWRSLNEPADLAEELVELGYPAMKLWSFDAVYRRAGGHHLSVADVEDGVAPFRAIRERVGDRIELILDGHGFFSLAAAERIAAAMQEVRPLWMEDVLRPTNVETMTLFRRRVDVPIAVSEMLVTREAYGRVLTSGACDFVMIDPTWVGGIGESRRIADLAALHEIPVAMHDCTGPLTLLAGMHVAASTPIVAWQETVRAHLATLYEHLIDEPLAVRAGTLPLPRRPGLGARWRDDLFDPTRPTYRVSEV